MRQTLMMTLLLLATLFATPTLAASFDCAKASAPDEKAICQNADLSSLDSEMGGLFFAYGKVPMLMGGNGARHDDAEAFLATRSACGGDHACLVKAYEDRISALKSNIEASMQVMFDLQNSDPAPAGLPPEVEAIVADYTKQCTQIGGTLRAGADRPLSISSDLDGDGVDDYVLNPQNLDCSAGATTYCGNGGCSISIAVSGNGYAEPISVMGGQPTVSQPEDGTVVDVWVDASNCGSAGAGQACWAQYGWSGGKLATTYQLRPIAQ